VIAVSIAVAWTRSVWLATAVAAAYLVGALRARLLLLIPLVLLAVFVVAPSEVQRRVTSIWQPHGTADSNDHRIITFRTGLEMVRAHPLLGVGPEIVGRDFMRYVPADIHRPLPEGFYGHLHNFYLQYAAERGLPALAALLVLIGMALVHFVRAARRVPVADRASRAVLHGAIACVIAILIEGFFELNLGDTEVLTMFLAILASGYATVEHTTNA
jgi:O-antigen ligase